MFPRREAAWPLAGFSGTLKSAVALGLRPTFLAPAPHPPLSARELLTKPSQARLQDQEPKQPWRGEHLLCPDPARGLRPLTRQEASSRAHSTGAAGAGQDCPRRTHGWEEGELGFQPGRLARALPKVGWALRGTGPCFQEIKTEEPSKTPSG